jgi:hypothetical protein
MRARVVCLAGGVARRAMRRATIGEGLLSHYARPPPRPASTRTGPPCPSPTRARASVGLDPVDNNDMI